MATPEERPGQSSVLAPVAGDVGPGAPVIEPEQSVGLWRYARAYARQRPIFLLGLLVVAVALVLAAIGPYIGPYDPREADSTAVLDAPSSAHWFGTDQSGLDIFSRTLAAPRIDVLVALAATAVSLALGSVIGLLVSFFEGRVGGFVMRAADVVQAFPLFVLAMILVTTSGRSLVALVFVIAFLNVPIYLRLIRSQVLTLKHRSFVEAARAVGNRETAIAFRHVLPNAMEPGIIQASVTIGFAILLTAGLSFIGAGVRPPTPEWGSMIASGAQTLGQGQWWTSVFPGVAMSLTVFGFATVAEGLRDVLRRGGGR
jgi:peptide/nickel transport system permease protein